MKSSPSPAMLQEAAELRARGQSWDAVGAKLGRAAETCRKWPILCADLFRRYFNDAADRFLLEFSGRCTVKLATFTNSENERVALDATKFLSRHCVALRELQRAQSRLEKTADPDLQLDEYLKGLSDEQLTELEAGDDLANLAAGQAAGEEPHGEGTA
jgi:hypothetical protein